MTTRYVDRCSVDGCPEPNSEEWHHCFVCGKAAIDHHHFPSRAQAGKGAKVVAVLCRNHHEKITLHQWREGVYTHPDGSVRYYVQNQKGEEQCERIIEAAPEEQASSPQGKVKQVSGSLEQVEETLPAVKEEIPVLGRVGPPLVSELNLSLASDEQLATLFAWADKQQKDSFLTKCQVVHAYRERHVQAWGESWVEEAYKLFESNPSRRTLEAYANIWTCVTSDASLLEHIGPLTDSRNLMQFIGRKKPEDGQIALEAAVAHYAEFAEPPTVKALAQRLGEEAKPVENCPKTGMPHDWQRVCSDCGVTR